LEVLLRLMASNGGSSSAFDDLPPSAKYVYREIDRAGGRLSRQELIDRTYLSPSTIDDALRTLESRHFVHKSRKSDALNQVVAETRQSPNS
jgi:DNA-binding MarR family transcriptional regulator